jgi:hypothetical protein
VVWPWTPDEKRRRRNVGFVSFMRRSDAEDAMDAIDGHQFETSEYSADVGKERKTASK